MASNSGFPNSPQPLTSTQLGSTPRGSQHAGLPQQNTGEALMELFKEYSRERPEVVAMWAFGIGFILGWKLKPW